MNNNEYTEKKTLNSVVNSFITSYAERDRRMEFSAWLVAKLMQELPDLSNDACEKLVDEIIEAVATYDKTLNELNNAMENGQSKEEWYAERLSETYADMSLDYVGEKLQKVENEFAISNMQLMREMPEIQGDKEEISTVDNSFVEWNEYSVKNKVYEIGKQIVLSGMIVTANVTKEKIQSDEEVNISGIIKETFQDGIIKESWEVKAAVAMAVKVAVEKGLEDRLPKDIPPEIIAGMSGVAVESSKVLFDVANGECTMTDALTQIGRISISEGGHFVSVALKGRLLSIPFAGPLLVDLMCGLTDYLESPKFTENVYNVFHDAAVATWEGIKESYIGQGVKTGITLLKEIYN